MVRNISPRKIGPDITPGAKTDAIKEMGQSVSLLESLGYNVECSVRVKRKGSDNWENIKVENPKLGLNANTEPEDGAGQ